MFVISVYLFQSDKTVAWQRTLKYLVYTHFDDLLQDKKKGISHHAPATSKRKQRITRTPQDNHKIREYCEIMGQEWALNGLWADVTIQDSRINIFVSCVKPDCLQLIRTIELP